MALVSHIFTLKNLRLPVNSKVIVTDAQKQRSTVAKIMGYSRDMTAICLELTDRKPQVDWYDIDSIVLMKIIKRGGDIQRKQSHEW